MGPKEGWAHESCQMGAVWLGKGQGWVATGKGERGQLEMGRARHLQSYHQRQTGMIVVCLPSEYVSLPLLLSVYDVKHADRLVGRTRCESLAVVVELGIVLEAEQDDTKSAHTSTWHGSTARALKCPAEL